MSSLMYKAFLYWVNYSRESIKGMSGKNIPIKLPYILSLKPNVYVLVQVQAWSKMIGKGVPEMGANVQKTKLQS